MRIQLPITIEEYKGDLFVEVTAIIDVYPGEPMVRYYPDGSGYPGAPPTAELWSVYIDLCEDVDGEPVSITAEEILEVADRVLVFYNGFLIKDVQVCDTTMGEIGQAIAGKGGS